MKLSEELLKAISEGLCLSASFDHCNFSEGQGENSKFLWGVLCRHFDLFSEGLKIFKAHPQGSVDIKWNSPIRQ